jgi:conjugal transfer mating pair stabilization protein TraN
MQLNPPLFTKITQILILSLILTIIGAQSILAEEICNESSRICTQGPETRTINGQEIYQECWNYNITYSCYDDAEVEQTYDDECSSIRNISTCSQTSSICESVLNNEICQSYKNVFQCSSEIQDHESINLTLESSSQEIVTEYIDESQCAQFIENESCTKIADRVCIDDTLSILPTQNINGLDVIRDCWNYQDNYSCTASNNECSELEESCDYQSEQCISQTDAGICTYLTKSYQCPINIEGSSTVSCGSQGYCIGDNCQSFAVTANQDFGKAASSLSMLEEAANDFDSENLTTFAGVSDKCGRDILGSSNCCDLDGWAGDFGGVVAGAMVGGSLFITGGVSGGLSLIAGVDIAAATELSGGFDFCSTSEKNLYIKNQNRQCHYIGDYCSDKEEFTNLCLQKKKTYCCFNSKLSRIIHEQGRAQIGKGWGSPQYPDCSGLTTDQLSQIDFTQIDFTEVALEAANNVGANVPSNDEIASRVSDSITNYYEGGEQSETY